MKSSFMPFYLTNLNYKISQKYSTWQVDLMLFNLLLIPEMLSLNSVWNMKHAIRSAKCGISANSNRNCSGLSNSWSDPDDT